MLGYAFLQDPALLLPIVRHGVETAHGHALGATDTFVLIDMGLDLVQRNGARRAVLIALAATGARALLDLRLERGVLPHFALATGTAHPKVLDRRPYARCTMAREVSNR